MKIEIDLNDILGDEYGAETLQESVRRQVIQNLTEQVSKGVKNKIDVEVSKVISETLQESIKAQMPALIDDLINTEYQPVTFYGDRKAKTTFRTELIKSIMEQMTYKRESYSDKENLFTKSVNAVISDQMKIIAADYKKTVDEFIGKQAFELAITTLKTKLGL
jgi:hypothetical protein